MKKITAPINKIIPFSNVDGPSNRTAIFFQGCQFNCRFCHNPETIRMCIHCGDCIETCSVGALRMINGRVLWDKNSCISCDTCIGTCTHSASPRIIEMTTDEVVEQIERTRPYIQGITLSGGECTIRRDFIEELFPKVKALGLSTLLDSNGSLDFEKNPSILEYCDGVMLDVKATDDDFHRWLTGVTNETVLKNLNYLLKIGKLYEVRTIIFPERDEDNRNTVETVSKIIQDRCFYKIIRYRQYGVREEQKKILGDDTTSEEYARSYVKLAQSLGASKAYLI